MHLTSYDAATGGNVVNQVELTYNDLHKVTVSDQAHDGAVTGGTPAVQYAYDLGLQVGSIWVDNKRLKKTTYTDGCVICYNVRQPGVVG